MAALARPDASQRRLTGEPRITSADRCTRAHCPRSRLHTSARAHPLVVNTHGARFRYAATLQVQMPPLRISRTAVALVARVAESWMLSRLNRETRQYHHVADGNRLAMLSAAVDQIRYAGFLTRIYGFEAPLEAAIQMTDGLDQWLDPRDRTHPRLLRADLQMLGVSDPNQFPRCPTIFPFRHAAEALGWIYVVERNTLLHGVIERHLRARMPEVLKRAGSYLSGQQRSNGLRLRDLGNAVDRIARDPECADRVVLGAKAAFRVQHSWYEVAVPRRQRVA
jgi:heme oxygenase